LFLQFLYNGEQIRTLYAHQHQNVDTDLHLCFWTAEKR